LKSEDKDAEKGEIVFVWSPCNFTILLQL